MRHRPLTGGVYSPELRAIPARHDPVERHPRDPGEYEAADAWDLRRRPAYCFQLCQCVASPFLVFRPMYTHRVRMRGAARRSAEGALPGGI